MEGTLGLGNSAGNFRNDGMSSETSCSIDLDKAVFDDDANNFELTSDDEL